MAKTSETFEIEYEYSKTAAPKQCKVRNKWDIKGVITVSLLTVMSLASAGLMIRSLLVRIELAEQSNIGVELKQQLEVLREENRKLRIEYEYQINLDELENYAINILEMQKPGKSRIKKIDTDTQDKAIVLGDSEKCNTVG